MVARYPNYEVSSRGRVRSRPRTIMRSDNKALKIEGRILNPWVVKGGYLAFDANGSNVPVAWCVAAAFLGDRPEGLEICHNDGDPSNNEIGNLRYDTHAANMADRVAHGTMPDLRGEKNSQSKLTRSDVRSIRRRRNNFTQAELADQFGVSQSTISLIHNGKTWRRT